MKSTFVSIFVVSSLLGITSAEAASDEAVEPRIQGVELLKQGKIDQAIGPLLKAAELNPKDPDVRLNLAYAYDRQGRIDEAIVQYEKAIELSPRNSVAHNNLGVLYGKKGRYEEAVHEFEEAAGIDPTSTKASENLATAKKNQAIVQTRERLLAEALSGAKAHPTSPIHAYKLARFYAFYGNRDQAIEWLERALTLGFNDLGYVKVDTALESLRDDPDYRWLVRGH